MNTILSFERKRRHVVITIVADRKRHARTRRRLGRVLKVLEVLEHVHGHTMASVAAAVAAAAVAAVAAAAVAVAASSASEAAALSPGGACTSPRSSRKRVTSSEVHSVFTRQRRLRQSGDGGADSWGISIALVWVTGRERCSTSRRTCSRACHSSGSRERLSGGGG